MLEARRNWELFNEGFGSVTDGGLDGQLAARLPGIVVVDEGRLLEVARLYWLHCKRMMNLQVRWGWDDLKEEGRERGREREREGRREDGEREQEKQGGRDGGDKRQQFIVITQTFRRCKDMRTDVYYIIILLLWYENLSTCTPVCTYMYMYMYVQCIYTCKS